MINNFFFLIVTLFFPFHDFHVTHTTFHYNDESNSMEITIKVAIEDLEKSIENKSTKELDDLSNNQENSSFNKRLEYLRNVCYLLNDSKFKEEEYVPTKKDGYSLDKQKQFYQTKINQF